jgi:hypothetical protein
LGVSTPPSLAYWNQNHRLTVIAKTKDARW